MSINPKKECCKGRRIDDADAVCFSRDKRERGVLVEAGEVVPIGIIEIDESGVYRCMSVSAQKAKV